MDQVSCAISRYQYVKQQILKHDPEIDERTLADTIEGLTDLHEIVAAIIRSVLVDTAWVAALRQRIQEMQQRLERVEDRISKRRGVARDVMTEIGLSKLVASDFTVSIRVGQPSLEVVEENCIPANFWIAQAPKLDRQALLKGLKAGATIPGVKLAEPLPVLSIRTL
jgi:hypothetical protein